MTKYMKFNLNLILILYIPQQILKLQVFYYIQSNFQESLLYFIAVTFFLLKSISNSIAFNRLFKSCNFKFNLDYLEYYLGHLG